METKKKLEAHLVTRKAELRKLKDSGCKIIGYIPNGYLPVELIYACGAKAAPVALIRGGEHEPVEASTSYLPRWCDTYCRAQIGYWALNEEPLYRMLDFFIVPVGDCCTRVMADTWDYFTSDRSYRLGIPHRKTDNGYQYYLEGLNLLKKKLEEVTGVEITSQRLSEAIALCNRERELLKEISLMRQNGRSPISGQDFIRLNHASLVGDKKVVIEALESIRRELKNEAPQTEGPRILFTGSTIALGDYKVPLLIEDAGGSIVIEHFAEGMVDYWEPAQNDGDPMKALADKYFWKKVPAAYFRPSRELRQFLIKLAREFKVDGVVWYHMLYRDAYDIESFLFSEMLKKETGLPMIKLISDYDYAEVGPFRTRIETFIETLRG